MPTPDPFTRIISVPALVIETAPEVELNSPVVALNELTGSGAPAVVASVAPKVGDARNKKAAPTRTRCFFLDRPNGKAKSWRTAAFKRSRIAM
jgi:hypothetical protein